MANEGSTNEGVQLITSEEELNQMLDGQQASAVDDDGKVVDTGDGAAAAAAKKPAEGDLLNHSADNGEGDGEGDDGNKDKDKDKPGEEKQYNNVVEFLNEKHGLELNIAELPKDLTREQEAEIVSGLFEKTVKGAQNALKQYESIALLMEEDEEVRALIQAKSEGKGLKDLFTAFSETADGKTNEQLVFSDFKKKYPKLTDDGVNKMISNLKEKGQFDEVATAIREQSKEDETKSAAQRAKDDEARIKQETEARKVEAQAFQQFVGGIKTVNGIPFTDEMKTEAFAYIFERDDEGVSPLDEALQSDVGIFRAALGIFFLERLLGANTSLQKNRAKKSVLDRLMDKPVEPGSGSGRETKTNADEIPAEVFNRF